MKNHLIVLAALTAGLALAEPSGDRPDARHAWSVHDVNRPDPVKIEVPAGGVPSDATVLFDGTEASIAKHWRNGKGEACQWTVRDGAFVCKPGSGSARTAEDFGDCQLHVEFMTPLNDVEGWGNSGVIFLGQYEIQILDSSAIVPSKSPWKPANYADGQIGAVYGQNPPIVNPCRKPGEWQSYDIVFHPPLREGERLVDPGSFTVFLNGVLVQDGWRLEGTTTWCARTKTHAAKAAGPLFLQDHGHPVPFRNIWIRRIPSRYADTIGGGVGTKRGDVAKKRHELAAESLGFALKTDDPAEKFIRLWESFCYEPDRRVKALLGPAEEACVKALAANDPRIADLHRFYALQRFVKMLVREKFLEPGGKLEKAMDVWKAPAKPAAPNQRDV